MSLHVFPQVANLSRRSGVQKLQVCPGVACPPSLQYSAPWPPGGEGPGTRSVCGGSGRMCCTPHTHTHFKSLQEEGGPSPACTVACTSRQGPARPEDQLELNAKLPAPDRLNRTGVATAQAGPTTYQPHVQVTLGGRLVAAWLRHLQLRGGCFCSPLLPTSYDACQCVTSLEGCNNGDSFAGNWFEAVTKLLLVGLGLDTADCKMMKGGRKVLQGWLTVHLGNMPYSGCCLLLEASDSPWLYRHRTIAYMVLNGLANFQSHDEYVTCLVLMW